MGFISRLKQKMDTAFTSEDKPLELDGGILTPNGSAPFLVYQDPETGRYVPAEDAKPIGQASVVQDDPLDVFPNENDNPS